MNQCNPFPNFKDNPLYKLGKLAVEKHRAEIDAIKVKVKANDPTYVVDALAVSQTVQNEVDGTIRNLRPAINEKGEGISIEVMRNIACDLVTRLLMQEFS